MRLLANSVLVATGATCGSLLVGALVAVWVTGLETAWRRRVTGLAVVALAMPPFLVTNCWLDLLGSQGVLHRWLPLDLFSLGGTVWVLTLLAWPMAMLATAAAWQRLEASQLEMEPGLRGLALVRHLLWPLARSGLGLAAALIFVLTLNNFAVPALLQVKVFPAEVWVEFNTRLDGLAALRLGWPLWVAPLALVGLWRWREWAWPRAEGGVPPALFRRQLGPGLAWSARVTGVTMLFLSVVLPLLQLAGAGRTWQELLPALQAGRDALWNSAWYAGATATGVVALGSWLSFGGGGGGWRSRGRKSEIRNPKSERNPKAEIRSGEEEGVSVSSRLVWLLFFVPGLFLGMALLFVFNRPGWDWVYQSSGIVLVAFLLRYLAVGWFGAKLAWEGMDPGLVDAGRMCGASGWRLWRHVVWPQVAPQLGAAWLVVYLLCLWEVETLILILPPGGETLALRVFNLLHYGHNSQVNALCLWLLGLAVLPLAGWRVVGGARRWWRQGAVAVALVATGCTPARRDGTFPLTSRIFDHVEIIGSRGVAPGQFNKPRSVAVDAQDNLYVADMTGRIQRFTPEGQFVLSWQMPVTELGKPKGLAHDRQGRMIVLEPHYARVNVFSNDGKLVAQWGHKGTNAGALTLPRSVAVTAQGDYWLSEYSDVERLQRFSPQGQLRQVLGHAGTGPGEFNRAESVSLDAQDRLYVADSCNHRIQVFAADGRFLRAYGRPGAGPGEMSYPYDVQVDARGCQYVCEFGNSRIQIFGADDQLLEILGGPGAAPGRFSNPWSIALDSKGSLYVADSQNHRVQKFVRREARTEQKSESRKPTCQIRNPKSEIRRGDSDIPRKALERTGDAKLAGGAICSAVGRFHAGHAGAPSDFGFNTAFGFNT